MALVQHMLPALLVTCPASASASASPLRRSYLPQEGVLDLCFVDLRRVPPGLKPLSRAQFATLVAHLVNMEVGGAGRGVRGGVAGGLMGMGGCVGFDVSC